MTERYETGEEIQQLPGGTLYYGQDLALDRLVLLYATPCAGEESRSAFLQSIGTVSGFSNECFMHLIDIEMEPHRVLVALSQCSGRPLIHTLEHRLAPEAVFNLVYELGMGMLAAMEERIVGYSVAAENLWVSDNQLKVIDYWTPGERSRTGTSGLCRLLYQLCVRTLAVPDAAELYEADLRRAFAGHGATIREALLRLTRRYRYQNDSLTMFMTEFGEILHRRPAAQATQDPWPRGPVRRNAAPSEQPAPAEVPVQQSPAWESSSPDMPQPRRSMLKIVLFSAAGLIVLFGFGFLVGAVHNALSAKSVPTASTPAASADATASATKGDASVDNGGKGNAQSSTQNNGDANHSTSADNQSTSADNQSASSDNESTATVSEPTSTDSESTPADNGAALQIPNLIGMTQKQAEQKALQMHLHYAYNLLPNDAAKGTVYKQDPAPGTAGKQGDRVTFWVSKGK